MKKVLTLFLMIALTMTVMAQNDEVKRVAVLKVVDESGTVSMGVKLYLRQILTVAINEVEGYEAYTRVNLSAIRDEHAFERSGYVSDDEIKELGRMNSVDYVLVAEVAPIEEGEGYITLAATIYDVVKGRIYKASEPEITSTEREELQRLSRNIAHTLLKGRRQADVVNHPANKQGLVNNDYVDLGLRSGTLWKNKNEDGGYYTYGDALIKFGKNLPTMIQFKELKSQCKWEWTGMGYIVTGPNGNSITLTAVGYQGCSGLTLFFGTSGYYLSSTTVDDEVFELDFQSYGIFFNRLKKCNALSVRLVN